MKKNRKTGFTLVELLVVIAIIALLLSVLIPSMNRAKEIAKRVVCGNGLKGIGSATMMYVDAYDNQLPRDRARLPGQTRDTVEEHPYLVYRTNFRDSNGKLIALRWACLFEKKYISDPKTFYCSGNNTNKSYRYESYIDPPPWGTLPQKFNTSTGGPMNEWVRIGYSYFPTDPASELQYDMQTSYPYREPDCTRFDKLDRSIPYATDLLWSRDSLSHKSGIRRTAGGRVIVLNPGLNALFKDGHVVFCGDRDVFTDDRTVAAGAIWYLMDTTNNLGNRDVLHYTIFKMIQP